MKAVVRSTYGSPEVLRIEEREVPTPGNGEVMVRVHATTVGRTDCGILWGRPFLVRLFTGLSRPRMAVTGSDFAGEVVALGPGVTSFTVGDRVMGFQGITGVGSHAQYVVFHEAKGMVTIPAGLSYEEAAACIEGAFYASVGMRYLRPAAGQKALVYGATGAIGSAYVQFLKHAGLYVTAVCGGEHRALIASLGADKVVDYKTEDFTRDDQRYDYVIDAVGKTSFARCKRLLTQKGKYSFSEGLVNILLALLTPWFGGKKVVFFLPKDGKSGLLYVRQVIEQGGFRPVIDRVYPVEQIREAYAYTASGQKVGSVVINGI